ncbi:hypothetical protein AVV49_gp42 [Pseudomonas phage PaMx74]|uniref:Uncharacterized protein n=1 Tax=Pseudomonas phage PaMx74 TaxID=1175663 RepID=A0A0S0MUZ7_9CAUD|nr:hypothetical protein AVV49_gp42 [Pseudomonas phage PaMx74]ALH23503.1 hypothetical protein PaMx74_42 [Pseudomonas phage PaMx74]
MCDQEGEDDGLGCARGLMWAVPLGILLWAVVVGSIVLVRSCHERSTVESGRSQAVEVPVAQALSRATVAESSEVRQD